MKVYVLDAFYGHGGDHDVLAVCDKPKTARLTLEKRINQKTKGKWEKYPNGNRYYKYCGTIYSIREFKLIKGKEGT